MATVCEPPAGARASSKREAACPELPPNPRLGSVLKSLDDFPAGIHRTDHFVRFFAVGTSHALRDRLAWSADARDFEGFLACGNRQPFLHNSPLVLSSDLTAAALEIAAASSSPLSDGNGRNNSSPVIQDLTLAFRGWKKCSLISLPMFLDFPKRLPFQFIGPPGGAKSATAKATGGTAGIPTIAFDLAAMESSLVGASTERLRTALKIIDAVSQGRMLFIATCNSIASLPPELRSRFMHVLLRPAHGRRA